MGFRGADADVDPRAYVVSVTFEASSEASRSASETSETGYEVEKVELDCEQLQRLQWKYGFSEPSSSHLNGSANIWFNTTSPRQDQQLFEQGVERHFALHIASVDGAAPTAADYQRVGQYLGIYFADQVLEEERPSPRP